MRERGLGPTWLSHNPAFLLTGLAILGIIWGLTGCHGGGAVTDSSGAGTNSQASQVTFQLAIAPASLDFAAVSISSSSTLPVVITNTGSASVTISNIATTGAGFRVSGPVLPYSLAAGQENSLQVTFSPSATGNATGSLSVVSNATNSPAIASLSGDGVNQSSVTLTWAPSTSGGVIGYNVYRGTISGGPYAKLNSSLDANTAYTDGTVEAGQTYYYVTTAVNSEGLESAYSNQATAAIPSP
jgi:hypothetical protein